MGYGRHCMCTGLKFYGRINYLLGTGFFIFIVQYYQLRQLSLLVIGCQM